MPLVPTPARFMLEACDQCHSSRVFTFLTSSHCKLRPNTEGAGVGGKESGGSVSFDSGYYEPPPLKEEGGGLLSKIKSLFGGGK
jgi:hypothetical protein